MNEQAPEQSVPEKIYEARGLTGPRLDFSRMRAGSRQEILTQSPEAQKLYDDITGIIDQEKYPLVGSNPEDIMGAIGIVAEENGWGDYADVNADVIRKELEKNGVPLRPRKTAQDFK